VRGGGRIKEPQPLYGGVKGRPIVKNSRGGNSCRNSVVQPRLKGVRISHLMGGKKRRRVDLKQGRGNRKWRLRNFGGHSIEANGDHRAKRRLYSGKCEVKNALGGNETKGVL